VPTTLPVPGPLLTATPVVTVPPVVVPPLPSPFQRDPTFASGGVFTKDFDKGFDTLSALALQPDGKLLVGGETITSTNVGDLVVLRLTVTGSPDPSFGNGGFVRYDAGGSEYPNAIVVQPDGKILVAGATGAFHSADEFGTNGRTLVDTGSTSAKSWWDLGLRSRPTRRRFAAGRWAAFDRRHP
jgi:uncharacterized delta-60 repeat protein